MYKWGDTGSDNTDLVGFLCGVLAIIMGIGLYGIGRAVLAALATWGIR
jgi:hypothetical protein